MIRVKVTESCTRRFWRISIYDDKKEIMSSSDAMGLPCFGIWERKHAAVRNAKAMAKRIGIKFDSEIIKQHGC